MSPHPAIPDSLWITAPPEEARAAILARTGRQSAGQAGWGFGPVAVEAPYGFRLDLRTSPAGAILGYPLAPADAAETEAIWEVAPDPPGVGPGDRNDWSPAPRAAFEAAGGRLLAPFKARRHDRARGGRTGCRSCGGSRTRSAGRSSGTTAVGFGSRTCGTRSTA